MDRARYKSDAKEAFKKNYWTCVIVSLVLFLFCTSHNGGGSSSERRQNNYNPGHTPGQSQYYQTPGNNPNYNQVMQMLNSSGSSGSGSRAEDGTGISQDPVTSVVSSVRIQAVSFLRILYQLLGSNRGLAAFMGTLIFIVVAMIAVGLLLYIFVFSPLEVGGRKFYIENAFGDTPSLSRLVYAFGCSHYLNIVACLFVRNILLGALFLPVALGAFMIGFSLGDPASLGGLMIVGLILMVIGLVCLIPRVYLQYSWRLVPYVLADDPSLSPIAALKESNRIMHGFRFESFILDLTFILWDILAVLTIYLAGIFWVFPYKDATYAEMYLDLSGNG